MKLAHSFSYCYSQFLGSCFSHLIYLYLQCQLIIQKFLNVFIELLILKLLDNLGPTPCWNFVTDTVFLPYKWSLSITLLWASLTASCIYSKGVWRSKLFKSTAKAASFLAEENFILIVRTHTCSEDNARSLKWI